MGNRHLYKIECLHRLGTPESERLKVTALNLFYPTASPLFQNVCFFILQYSHQGGRGTLPAPPSVGTTCLPVGRGGGDVILLMRLY
jgi:hypothetical protein